MNERKGKKEEKADLKNIRLDYDNIDVTDIMSQIKKKIETDLEQNSELIDKDEQESLSPLTEDMKDEEIALSPSGKKVFLAKLMKPFSPIIKLLVFPVYRELRETIEHLDRTNKRLDVLSHSLDTSLDEIKRTLAKFNTETNQRVDLAHEELTRAKEYARLLHNLSHNTVVEMTKLKIEEENLKSRIRILEKDFENLKSRERALESKVNS